MVDKIGDTMKIAILPGDGIGPEVILEVKKVIKEKTNDQLNQFSNIFFNKIQKNITINEL